MGFWRAMAPRTHLRRSRNAVDLQSVREGRVGLSRGARSMRYLVNGFAAEKVESADTTVSQVGDTLVVHEPEGSFTAVVVRQGEKTLVSYRGNVYEIER